MTHATLDRIARQLCEQSRGVGAWDRKGCKREYWRKSARALELLDVSPPLSPILRVLMRAARWLA